MLASVPARKTFFLSSMCIVVSGEVQDRSLRNPSNVYLVAEELRRILKRKDGTNISAHVRVFYHVLGLSRKSPLFLSDFNRLTKSMIYNRVYFLYEF